MSDERRQNPGGRREGRDRRKTRALALYSAYATNAAYSGMERRVAERRLVINRRGP
jgi:hypothetical protein